MKDAAIKKALSVLVSLTLAFGFAFPVAYADEAGLQAGPPDFGQDASAFRMAPAVEGEYGDSSDSAVEGMVDEGEGLLIHSQADGLKTSGTKTVGVRTASDLRARWNAIPEQPTGMHALATQNDAASYKPATLTSQSLSYALAYINFIRYAAGLGDVSFTDVLNDNAAQGALIMATGNQFGHYPSTPAGVSEEAAKPGKYACATSNISCMIRHSGMTTVEELSNEMSFLQSTIQGQMDDSDSRNFTEVGHRRWLLSPKTSTMGYGAAMTLEREDYESWGEMYSRLTWEVYSAIRVLTKERDGNYDSSYGIVGQSGPDDFEFVAWPASGAFPNEVFAIDTPWSVSLNTDYYMTPSPSSVRVTLTRLSDNKKWTMSDAEAAENISPKDSYLRVSQSYIGDSNCQNCIIFNPGGANVGANAYEGSYRVDISGLKTRNGESTTLSYQVDFTSMGPGGGNDPAPSPSGDDPDPGTGDKPSKGTKQVEDIALFDIDGTQTTLADAYGGTKRVIIVGEPDDTTTRDVVSEALELSRDPTYSDVNFLILDDDDDMEAFKEGFGNLETDKVRFYSDWPYGDWAWTEYVEFYNGSATLPFIVLVDESDTTVMVETDWQDLAKLCSDYLATPQSSDDDPIVDPGDTNPDPAPQPGPTTETQPMYRLYNPNSGEHFYTAVVDERDYLSRVGWSYEGVGWTAPVTSNTPVYRLYNPYAGDHHYTPDAAERDALVKVGWNDEGTGWFSDDAQGTPLYRQYNPYATTGTHNYTTDKSENDYLASIGWNAEGIGWYGVAA